MVFEGELACPLCGAEYREDNPARLLTGCGHTFCEDCIRGFMQEVGDAFSVGCPEDGIEVKVSSRSLKELPRNIALMKVVSSKKAAELSNSLDVSNIPKDESQGEPQLDLQLETSELINAMREEPTSEGVSAVSAASAAEPNTASSLAPEHPDADPAQPLKQACREEKEGEGASPEEPKESEEGQKEPVQGETLTQAVEGETLTQGAEANEKAENTEGAQNESNPNEAGVEEAERGSTEAQKQTTEKGKPVGSLDKPEEPPSQEMEQGKSEAGKGATAAIDQQVETVETVEAERAKKADKENGAGSGVVAGDIQKPTAKTESVEAAEKKTLQSDSAETPVTESQPIEAEEAMAEADSPKQEDQPDAQQQTESTQKRKESEQFKEAEQAIDAGHTQSVEKFETLEESKQAEQPNEVAAPEPVNESEIPESEQQCTVQEAKSKKSEDEEPIKSQVSPQQEKEPIKTEQDCDKPSQGKIDPAQKAVSEASDVGQSVRRETAEKEEAPQPVGAEVEPEASNDSPPNCAEMPKNEQTSKPKVEVEGEEADKPQTEAGQVKERVSEPKLAEEAVDEEKEPSKEELKEQSKEESKEQSKEESKEQSSLAEAQGAGDEQGEPDNQCKDDILLDLEAADGSSPKEELSSGNGLKGQPDRKEEASANAECEDANVSEKGARDQLASDAQPLLDDSSEESERESAEELATVQQREQPVKTVVSAKPEVQVHAKAEPKKAPKPEFKPMPQAAPVSKQTSSAKATPKRSTAVKEKMKKESKAELSEEEEPKVQTKKAKTEVPVKDKAKDKAKAKVRKEINDEEDEEKKARPTKEEVVDICLLHQKPLEVVCIKDMVRICVNCAIFGEHKGHDFKSLEEIGTASTEHYDEMLTLMEKKHSIFERLTSETARQDLLTLLAATKETLKKQVVSHYERLAAGIRAAQKETLQHLEKLIKNHAKELNQALNIDKSIEEAYTRWEQRSFAQIDTLEKGSIEEKLGLLFDAKNKQIIDDGAEIVVLLEKHELDLMQEAESIFDRISVSVNDSVLDSLSSFVSLKDSAQKAAPVQSKPDLTPQSRSPLGSQMSLISMRGINDDDESLLGEEVVCSDYGLAEVGPVSPTVEGSLNSLPSPYNAPRHPQLQQASQGAPVQQCLPSVQPSVQQPPVQQIQQIQPIQPPLQHVPQPARSKIVRTTMPPLDPRPITQSHTDYENHGEEIVSRPSAGNVLPKDDLNTSTVLHNCNTNSASQKKKLAKLNLPEKVAKAMDGVMADSAEIVDFTNAELGDHVVATLMDFIRGSKVRNLKLIRNKLSDAGVKKVLPCLGGVVTLNLSQNLLTDAVLDAISEHRPNLPALKSVILCQNKIIERKHKAKINALKSAGLNVSV